VAGQVEGIDGEGLGQRIGVEQPVVEVAAETVASPLPRFA
jgi:hypothetical protein